MENKIQLRSKQELGEIPKRNYVLIQTSRGTNLTKCADFFSFKFKWNCWEVIEGYLLVTYNHVIRFHKKIFTIPSTFKSLLLWFLTRIVLLLRWLFSLLRWNSKHAWNMKWLTILVLFYKIILTHKKSYSG